MAHKARRRPSWKKPSSKKDKGYYFYHDVSGVHCFISREASKEILAWAKLQASLNKQIGA